MSRLDISNNGESDFARAVAPMISAGHQNIDEICSVHVLSFLNPQRAEQIRQRYYAVTYDDANTHTALEEEKSSTEMKNI